MAFMDIMFRRTSKSTSGLESEQERTAEHRSDRAKPGGGFYYWSFFIHKWAGLIGAAWLAALGATGFLLDHDSWRWLQQNKVPAWLTTRALDQNASRNVLRLLQIDPDDETIQVGGGLRGLWTTHDAGKTWTATAFAGGDRPQILAIEPDPSQGWGRLWFATDDGVYVSQDKGASARRLSLPGEYVTYLAAGAGPSDMLGVIDHSRVFTFSTEDPAEIKALDLTPLEKDERPLKVQLSRFLRDLHFGKGVIDPISSLVMNDVGGIAMFVLSLTGLLYWGLPKWWKWRAGAMKSKGLKPNKAARRATIVWLFRLHSATLGVASAVIILYLSVTGVFIGHSRELRGFLRGTLVPQTYLTPAFAMSSWNGWIDSIVGYPDAPGVFSIGSRLGLFTTSDGGKSWAREDDANGKPVLMAQRMRRLGEAVVVTNGMAGPSAIRGAGQANREVVIDDEDMSGTGAGLGGGEMGGAEHARHLRMNGAGGEMRETGAAENASGARRRPEMGMGGMENMFMPTDVTRYGGRLLWKSSNKLYVTDKNGNEIERLELNQPLDPGTPWFTWFLRLHIGTIFWSEWRWVNDAFAILAVFLSVTGLVRWWRQKWI
jgi:hypothetical protein